MTEDPSLRHPPAGAFRYPRLLGGRHLYCQGGAREWFTGGDGGSRVSLGEQCWVPRGQWTACCVVWWGHSGYRSLAVLLGDLGQLLHYKEIHAPPHDVRRVGGQDGGSSGPHCEGPCESQRAGECGIVRTLYFVCPQFLAQSAQNLCDFLGVRRDRDIIGFNAMTLSGAQIASDRAGHQREQTMMRGLELLLLPPVSRGGEALGMESNPQWPVTGPVMPV